MAEQEKRSYEEMYNKKERLKVIKQGILNYLYQVGKTQRERIDAKLQDLEIYENPYKVFSFGVKSKKVPVHATSDEITYCLNFLKGKGLIEYDESIKRWVLLKHEDSKKKGLTLESYFNNTEKE